MFRVVGKILFTIVAFSVINQSTSLDFLTISTTFKDLANYDDIDSITEFVIETIMHDDHYMPEDNNHRSPQNKSMEKPAWNALYCQAIEKIEIVYPDGNTAGYAISHTAPGTCRGYFNIVSPPPDTAA